MERVTFWLYYGSQIVASVRADAHESEGTIRRLALASHDRLPLCDRPLENPFERRYKIVCAEIKR